MKKACCGFGHRDVFVDIKDNLDKCITKAIEIGCTTFYVGNQGEFDRMFSGAVRRAKSKNKNIKLVLVRPYMTNELNKNKELYYYDYDDIIIPTELDGLHPKQILTKRNQWMIDQCDVVIGYVYRDFGGAYNSIKYAEKKNKTVLRVL